MGGWRAQHMAWVGIDAGGTNIRIAWTDKTGNAGRLIVDAAVDGSPEPLRRIREALPDVADAVVAGITKITRDSVADQWRTALVAWFPDCPVAIVPDWRIAHEGAFDGTDGVLILAGTGSVAVGRRNGRFHRTGGRGWEYGDEGSGAHLTADAIRRTVRALDQQSPTTPLTTQLVGHVGIDEPAAFVEECRRRAVSDGRGFLVPFLAEMARAGDPEAIDLIRGAAGWLSRLGVSNASACGFPFEDPWTYSTLGGIFECGPWADEQLPILIQRRCPQARRLSPVCTAVDGALRMARHSLADCIPEGYDGGYVWTGIDRW